MSFFIGFADELVKTGGNKALVRALDKVIRAEARGARHWRGRSIASEKARLIARLPPHIASSTGRSMRNQRYNMGPHNLGSIQHPALVEEAVRREGKRAFRSIP